MNNIIAEICGPRAWCSMARSVQHCRSTAGQCSRWAWMNSIVEPLAIKR